ncbi:MAG: hypothetical protein RI926_1119 [Actinomycetota bacterium]|jgi:AcrR family transcriptional regulator
MPEAANTQDRLLEAAIDVIDQGGVKALRVRDISARAGVKEPSVYHYFGSRDGLIEAAQAQRYIRGLLELTQVFDKLVHQCTTRQGFIETIRTVNTAVFAENRQSVRAVRADVLGSAMSRPELKMAVAQAQRESHNLLDSTLTFAQSQGWVLPELDTMAFSVWYTGMVNGRLVLEIDPSQCSAEAWNKIAIDLTVSALCGSQK